MPIFHIESTRKSDIPVSTPLDVVGIHRTERRSGNATNHIKPGYVPTDTPGGIELGTQPTGPSKDKNTDAPLNPTPANPEDGGNKRGGGDPGTIAQGEGGKMRVRDIEGEQDLACQILHSCENQLIAVYGDIIHHNDG
jgi:hypothetical protein